MSFIISNPFPYLKAFPFSKLSINSYFKIFDVFAEIESLGKDQVLKKIRDIFVEDNSDQSVETIVSNYIPMYKALGIIDKNFNLTSFGLKLKQKLTDKEKQFDLLYELIHRKWFVFSFYHIYKYIRENPAIKKKAFMEEIVKIFKENGFYVGDFKRHQKKNPNHHRIEAIWNLLYFTGFLNKKSEIQNEFITGFEKFLQEKFGEEDQGRNLESFLKDIINIITQVQNEEEVELMNVDENMIDNFNERVYKIYIDKNEPSVFIDDIERELNINDPNFFDKLWLLQEEGSAHFIVGRDTGIHKAYKKYGRYHTKMYFT